jgi:sugar phosphate isomerase/epimerase
LKLCFSTLGCPDWSWSSIIAAANDLGYDGIEVRGVEGELRAAHIRELTLTHAVGTRARLDELGLTLPCFAASADLSDRERREEILWDGCETIDTAERMAARFIRLLGDKNARPGTRVDESLVLDNLLELSDIASRKGIIVLVETNGYFADTAILARLLEKAKGVGALWDIHHPYRFNNESPKITVENLRGSICHVHMKDSLVEGDRIRYLMMGEGTLPVEECVGLLMDSGYEGYFSLEWLKRWDTSLEEPGIVFAHYITFMEALKR